MCARNPGEGNGFLVLLEFVKYMPCLMIIFTIEMFTKLLILYIFQFAFSQNVLFMFRVIKMSIAKNAIWESF